MPFFTDQTGYTLELTDAPRRIVSLVPSQTELLFDLGLEEEVVGITKFCVHPQSWFQHKKRVGGTKSVHLNWVLNLNPDLIIANKEENLRSDIEKLREQKAVWTSDINTLEAALQMIHYVSEITGKTAIGQEMVREIAGRFAQIRPSFKRFRTLYLIWKKPYMCVGKDSFIYAMLQSCGFDPVPGDQLRYPELKVEEIRSLNPELILLSSEPYPFKEKDLDEIRLLLPDSRLELVDGEFFSWYGSRLSKAPHYFQYLIDKLNANP